MVTTITMVQQAHSAILLDTITRPATAGTGTGLLELGGLVSAPRYAAVPFHVSSTVTIMGILVYIAPYAYIAIVAPGTDGLPDVLNGTIFGSITVREPGAKTILNDINLTLGPGGLLVCWQRQISERGRLSPRR